MSDNVEIHIYEKEDLIEKLRKWGATDNELTVKILESCGTFAGNTYILLNNEYNDDLTYKSPYYNISILFDCAFKTNDSFDIFLDSGTEGINTVELYDISDKLGIELIEDFI